MTAGLFLFSLCGCGSSSNPSTNEVKGAYKETVLANGIGKTVNAITDKYAEVSSKHQSIFEASSLEGLTINKTPLLRQEASSCINSKMEDFLTSLNEKCSTIDENKESYQLFVKDPADRFAMDGSFEYTSETRELFYTLSQNVVRNRIEIDGYTNTAKLQSALSTDFIADVASVDAGTMAPADFFSKYGTHVVLAGYFGGHIRCDYSLAANNLTINTSAYFSYKNQITQILTGVITGKSVPGSLDISAALNFSKTNETEKFDAQAYGGKTIPMATEEEFADNFAAWAASLNGTDEYDVLTDFPSESLKSLWTLLPEQYQNAKKVLKNEFDAEASTAYSDFLAKYEISEEKFINVDIPTAPQNCSDNNGYDIGKPLTDETSKKEINPSISLFTMNDIIEKDGAYQKGFLNFSIGVKTTQNPDQVTIYPSTPGSAVTRACLSNDSFLIKDVTNVNRDPSDPAIVNNESVGLGVCFFEIHYRNGNTKFLIADKVFDGLKAAGGTRSLLSQDQLTSDKISYINLSLVYEIAATYSHWTGDQTSVTDWRIDQKITFC